jgi:hypothetical protein|tara:strand:+ start:17 stop:556 length:540 start_codon:yes stop_codon:yes gene_type:complete
MDKMLQAIVNAFGECEIEQRGNWVALNTDYIKKESSSFHEDLAEGKKAEYALCNIIKQKYPKAFVREGYCKGYDLSVPEIEKTIEVKQDKKSNHTGNIVIEVEMPVGTPSALLTTTADFWAFYDGECFMWWKPEDLKKLIEPMRAVEFVGNGDTTRKKAYLVKKYIIKDKAIKLTEYKD